MKKNIYIYKPVVQLLLFPDMNYAHFLKFLSNNNYINSSREKSLKSLSQYLS